MNRPRFEGLCRVCDKRVQGRNGFPGRRVGLSSGRDQLRLRRVLGCNVSICIFFVEEVIAIYPFSPVQPDQSSVPPPLLQDKTFSRWVLPLPTPAYRPAVVRIVSTPSAALQSQAACVAPPGYIRNHSPQRTVPPHPAQARCCHRQRSASAELRP